MNPLPPDPVIDDIREIRKKMSARFDHDPVKLVAYLREFEKQYEQRQLKAVELLEKTDTPAA